MLPLFHVDWTDIQLLEQVDITGINGNGGKAQSQGVEWTIRICARAWPDTSHGPGPTPTRN